MIPTVFLAQDFSIWVTSFSFYYIVVRRFFFSSHIPWVRPMGAMKQYKFHNRCIFTFFRVFLKVVQRVSTLAYVQGFICQM